MPDPLRDRLQRALGDAFTLERELGGGGMARVYVARETALGRDVVVKIVAPELTADVGAERFAREVRLAARLQHANIVPVLTAGDAEGMAYYTMPYVRGETLRTRVARGPVPVAEAVAILRDMARALAYAHGEGVVHRDIKPENVLLAGDAALVADFGIAKALSAAPLGGEPDAPRSAHTTDITRVGNAVGTPAYMAPEQAAGDPDTDGRADLYAWGVVAWELLAGAHPFAGKTTPRQMLAAQMSETPAALTTTRGDVAPALGALIAQCLEKEPTRRPASARALLTALDATLTPGAMAVERPRGRSPNARRAWLIGAPLAAVVVALTALWLWRRDRPAQSTTASTTRTVVVVPFDNLGAAEDAYFADGISDEIAGRLARIPGLRVVARASVLRYRGSTKSPQEIARELGAEYALSGSIRWARSAGASGRGANDSTMVRIVPALVRASTGAQLWGEPLQQRLTDVFKVQADVAERVAAALSLTLGGADLAAARRSESTSADARDAQLLGRYLLKQRGLRNVQRAAAEFRRAVRLDSSYARAWAGLSEAIGYLPVYGDTMSIAQSTRESAAAARGAIALDSLLSDAHVALALALEHDLRFAEALAAAGRGISLDHGSATAWKERGVMLLALGRVAEAEMPLRQAVELEPLLPVARIELANWFSAIAQPDSVTDQYRRVLELDPGNVSFRMFAEIAAGANGRTSEARAHCVEATGNVPGCRDLWRDATDSARATTAKAVLDTMGLVPRTATAFPASWQSVFYARLGATDSAFSRLSFAVRAKDPYLYSVINHPALTALRNDPRWGALIARYRGR